MPNFITRNLLICVVPTVVALLSVYWFRRKKKHKANIYSPPKAQTVSKEESGRTQSVSKEESASNSSTSVASTPESSDTLSDASSLTSPESSDKSLRTKPPLKNETNDIKFESNTKPSKLQSNHIDINLHNANVFNAAESSFYNENGLNSPSVDENVKMENECLVGNNIEKLSIGKISTSIPKSDVEENESLTSPSNISSSLYSKDKIVCNHQQIFDASEALFKMLNSSQDNDLVIENGSLYSLYSNQSPVSSHGSELEKIHTFESDSGDSHSSVLDENSLSYISDESESRQAANLKNKGSFSSALDGNSLLSSLCDESEKSNGGSPSVASNTGLGFKGDSIEIEEKVLAIKVNSDLSVFPLSEETKDTIEEDVSKIKESLTLSSPKVEVQNRTKDSIDADARQSPTFKSVDHSADFKMDSKVQTKSLNTVTNSVSGDNSFELSWASIFSDKSSKSSMPVNLEASQNSSNCLVEDTISKNDKESEVIEPQIVEMDITERLNMKVTPLENSTETEEARDSQSEILNSNKTDENEISPKVPENPSSQYVYEFDLPQDLCGRLIGKQGKCVKNIKDRSNANVYIKRHVYDPNLKTVVVEGNRTDVNEALEIIRRKYPPSRFPTVTLVKTNLSSPTGILPESLQLHLPDSVSCDVVLSSLVSAGHFFLQQPTHPTYPSLGTLDRCMYNCYQQLDTPLLPHPVEAGVICAAPVLRGWYRAQVVYVYETEVECTLKFVDYGGFSSAPTSSLRQIRSDFMSLPFQASECYLANVRPVDPTEGWSSEAYSTFEELAQGQILQAQVVEYAEDGVPCVHLYRVQGVTNMFINKELVERGLAVWVNNSHWDPH